MRNNGLKLWLHWAARLYPAAWRARYAVEFAALLGDLRPGWRDLWDVLRGALIMQLSTPVAYMKLGVITAALGALVAAGVSFTVPDRYVSSAVFRVNSEPRPDETAWQSRAIASRRLQMLQQDALSRVSLAEIIQRPALDLYQHDRSVYPLEDIIENMRTRDLRIEPVAPEAVRISFEYPDRPKAQAVVNALLGKFGAANVAVLDPASLPDKPIHPDRLAIIGIGLGSGFLLGLLAAFLRRQPLRWTLRMAGAAIAGFLAAVGITLLMPDTFANTVTQLPALPWFGAGAGLVLAAFLMRDRAAWNSAPYVKTALAFGATAAVVAGIASFAFPEHYVSTAVMRVYPRIGNGGQDLEQQARERLSRIEQEVLSRSSLAEMIHRPALDLYRSQRQRRPIEDIIRDMRAHDTHIAMLGGQDPADPLTSFSISFEYPDAQKAQAVVREFVTRFTELNYNMDRTPNPVRAEIGTTMEMANPGWVPGIMLHAREGEGVVRTSTSPIAMEVLDPASLPSTPVSPNRPIVVAVASGLGAALGLLIAFLRRRPPGQAWAMLRFAGISGAAGAAVAACVAFAIPSRYVSTAVLRVRPPASVPIASLQDQIRDVLGHRMVEGVRREEVRIQPITGSALGSPTAAFSISVESSDPVKAHAAVQAFVDRFLEGPANAHPSRLEVLDAASTPEFPVFPARSTIIAAGLLAGLLLTPLVLLLRPLTVA